MANYEFTILMVGDRAVGKTELRRRLLHSKFEEAFIATTASEATKHIIQKKEVSMLGKTLSLTIIDAPGQVAQWDIFTRTLRDKKIDASLIVCDLTQWETIQHIKMWKEQLTKIKAPEPRLFVGNKEDLKATNPFVSDNQGKLKKFAEGIQVKHFFTSAKKGIKVQEMFEAAISPLISGAIGAKKSAEVQRRVDILNKITATYKKAYELPNLEDILKNQIKRAHVDKANPQIDQLKILINYLTNTFGPTEREQTRRKKFKRLCENMLR